MNRQRTAVTMAAIMAFSAAAPMTAEASSSYSMRKKVITAAGIMTAESDDSRLVTRAQFAEMLVKASTYRSSVSSENNVSIFSDVDRNSEYASYIRVAVEQGWMTGYLGGKFKPDENITILATSDMQFAFSVYGDLKVGDEIIVIWENKTASAVDDDNDNPEYKLIDYIE